MLTKRGVQGGTFVVEPDAAHVEGILNFSLDLLAMTNQVRLDDFLDAWHAIEAPAAQLAAKRCHPDDVGQPLRSSDALAGSATWNE